MSNDHVMSGRVYHLTQIFSQNQNNFSINFTFIQPIKAKMFGKFLFFFENNKNRSLVCLCVQ